MDTDDFGFYVLLLALTLFAAATLLVGMFITHQYHLVLFLFFLSVTLLAAYWGYELNQLFKEVSKCKNCSNKNREEVEHRIEN